MSISLGFDKESDQELRNLQQRILPTVNAFRNRKVIEPEFRNSIQSAADPQAMHNTVEFGEPFIGDLFHPHITIVSGVKAAADRTTIEGFINIPELSDLELKVNKISVVYETLLCSSWEVLKEITLT
jgi:hypothetical protein